MMKPIPAEETFANLTFPERGVHQASEYTMQPTGTTPTGENVRFFESLTEKGRGGSRPGLARFVDQALGNEVQCMDYIVTTDQDAIAGRFNGVHYGVIGVYGGIGFSVPGWTTLDSVAGVNGFPPDDPAVVFGQDLYLFVYHYFNNQLAIELNGTVLETQPASAGNDAYIYKFSNSALDPDLSWFSPEVSSFYTLHYAVLTGALNALEVLGQLNTLELYDPSTQPSGLSFVAVELVAAYNDIPTTLITWQDFGNPPDDGGSITFTQPEIP